MKGKRCLCVGAGLLVAAVLLLSPACGKAESPAAEELLRMIPGESAFCACANDIEQAFTDLDAYLTGLSSTPLQVRNQVLLPLGAMIGNPTLAGVDLKRPLGAFGILKQDTRPEGPMDFGQLLFVGFLIPVSDYAEFAAKSGIVDTGAEAPSEEGAGMAGPLAKQVGRFAFLSPTSNRVEFLAVAEKVAAGAGMDQVLSPADARDARSKSVWVYADLAAANKLLAPKMDAFFTGMQSKMTAAHAATGQPQAAPRCMDTIIGFYKGMAEKLLAEGTCFTVSASFAPEAVTLTSTLTALPDTAFAELMAGTSGSVRDSRMLNYLADGAMMNMVGCMDTDGSKRITQDMTALFLDLIETESEEQRADMESMVDDFTAAMGGSFTVSARMGEGGVPFLGDYYYEIQDEARYNQAMDRAADMVNNGVFNDLYRGFGMELEANMTRGTSTYEAASIDSFTFNMKAVDMDEQTAAMINAMYGQGFSGHMALVDGMLVYAFGGESDRRVKELIDSVKAGGPKSVGSETQAALALLPAGAEPDFFLTYNYVRLMQMSGKMMAASLPAATGEDVTTAAFTAMQEAFNVPTESSFVVFGSADNGRGSFSVILPKKHIMELTGCFKTMMMKSMEAAMPPPPIPESPPDQPVPED